MRAVVFQGKGGPEVVGLREVADPSPQRGEVLVRVRASDGDGAYQILALGQGSASGPAALRLLLPRARLAAAGSTASSKGRCSTIPILFRPTSAGHAGGPSGRSRAAPASTPAPASHTELARSSKPIQSRTGTEPATGRQPPPRP